MSRSTGRIPDANKADDSASSGTVRSTNGINDPLLGRFLQARTEDERQQAMAELLSEHAHVRIDRILASRFRQSSLPFDQMDDVRGEIVLRLVKRLRGLAEHAAQPIAGFRDYVAIVAFNTFDEFVRRAWPLRTKLRNRIRYVATHHERLAMWETGGVLVCGLAEWDGRAPASPPAAPIELPAKESELRAALLRLFIAIQLPLALEDVVSILARTYGYPAQETPRPLDPLHDLPAGAQPGRGVESAQYLRNLWNEIRALPLHQRHALLLHARDADGEAVVRLLPLARVATIAAIAGALEIAPEELAALWRELPIDDLSIAARLGLTRPQVISLRRSARERLTRRMRGREEERTRR